jgi:hypothetical protein
MNLPALPVFFRNLSQGMGIKNLKKLSRLFATIAYGFL